ncbi:MAG: hypothetical protein HDQ88_12105 [Clostridia bacterium]|nr:hypothetical protein [Clostridia bacterium]
MSDYDRWKIDLFIFFSRMDIEDCHYRDCDQFPEWKDLYDMARGDYFKLYLDHILQRDYPRNDKI